MLVRQDDGHQNAATKTLTIDKAFDLKTADPSRMYEPTGEMVSTRPSTTPCSRSRAAMSRGRPGLSNA